MPSIIENLNSVITTKNELGYILRENGVNPGEVFSDYPTYFRDVISSGGGGSDKVTYSYLEERLSEYVSYSYGNDNYVSYAYLNEQEYATESYVAEYVAEHGGGEVTYSYLNDNYLKLTGGLLNGSIIPNYTETYSLGGTYNKWAGVYSNKYELNGVDIKEIFPSYSYVNKYVTKTELSAQSYITSADIPDLSTYVTKDELSAQSYITNADLPDLSTYVTKDELSAQSYLTSVPNTYPTYAAIESMGYITSADLPDLSTYVTKDELEGMSYATTSDLSNYLLSPTISGYEGQMKLYNDGFFEVTSSGAIRAKSFTYNQLNTWSAYTLINKNSLRNYVDGRIADIESTYVTKNELSAQSYATTSDLAGYLPITGGNLQGNLIPSQSASYNLGSSSSRWKEVRSKFVYTDTAYTSNLYADIATYTNNIFMDGHSITYRNSSSILFSVNNRDTFIMLNNSLCPSHTGINLGIDYASNKWASTYTSNIYADNAYISNYGNLIWTGTAVEYAALSDYTTYQIYLIQE